MVVMVGLMVVMVAMVVGGDGDGGEGDGDDGGNRDGGGGGGGSGRDGGGVVSKLKDNNHLIFLMSLPLSHCSSCLKHVIESIKLLQKLKASSGKSPGLEVKRSDLCHRGHSES